MKAIIKWLKIWYGPQNGDLPATIDHADQQAQAVAGTISFLDRLQ